MASYKALCLAGVVSLAATATTAAHAADLLPPPPPVEYQPPSAPAIGGGWYLRGDVGAGALQLNNAQSTFNPDFPYATANGQPPGFAIDGLATDAQLFAGAGVGYQINHYFRADVTGEYRFGSRYQAVETAIGCNGPFGGCADGYDGHISNAVFLINGYIDLGTWYHVTPYIGAGAGAAINMFSSDVDTNLIAANSGGISSPNSHTSFAYAFMAGLAYDLTPNLKLDIGYRYLDMGRLSSGAISCYPGTCDNNSREVQNFHETAQDVRVGLRYSFADFVPYQPQIPIIAKY